MIICGLFTKNLKRVASKQGTPPSVYPQDALESELIRFRSGVARFRRQLQHPPHRALYSAPNHHHPNRRPSPFLFRSVSGAFYYQAFCVRTMRKRACGFAQSTFVAFVFLGEVGICRTTNVFLGFCKRLADVLRTFFYGFAKPRGKHHGKSN